MSLVITRQVSAKEVARLELLATDMALARSAYEHRAWNADKQSLKRKATEARIRYRQHFFLTACGACGRWGRP